MKLKLNRLLNYIISLNVAVFDIIALTGHVKYKHQCVKYAVKTNTCII